MPSWRLDPSLPRGHDETATITRAVLPVQLQDQLGPRRDFTAMRVSSWRETAAAAIESVDASFKAFEAATGSERSYRAWESIASAVEMAEMFATSLINPSKGRHGRNTDAKL
jgi:hypothetical protein